MALIDLKTATCSAQKTFKECSCLLLSREHTQTLRESWRITSIRLKIIGLLLEMQLGSLAVWITFYSAQAVRARRPGLLKCLFAHTERGLEKKIIIRELGVQKSIKPYLAGCGFFCKRLIRARTWLKTVLWNGKSVRFSHTTSIASQSRPMYI